MYKFFQIDETADNPLRLMKFLRDVENIVVIIKPDHYEFAFEDPDTHELRYIREGWGPLRARQGDVLYIDNGNPYTDTGNLHRLDMKTVGIVDAWRKWRSES